MARVTENEVALAVVKIAASQRDGICTFDLARSEVPKYLNLSVEDLQMSTTRPNEPMWHQQIRNIQSHHDAPDNFIYEGYLVHIHNTGYEVTAKGRKL